MAYQAKRSKLPWRELWCSLIGSTDGGQSFYWHPDWLHIAEDETGLYGKHEIEVEQCGE